MKKNPVKKGLSDADWAVCQRVAQAREKLGVMQADFARAIGIPQTTLSSYELGKAPIKADLGLRICRTWIISEEWLATGEYKIAREIAFEKHNLPKGADLKILEEIFFRQCMDLASHPIARSLPPGMKFADAFNNNLSSAYRELIKIFYYFPRIEWLPNEWELGERLSFALIHRWLLMVRSVAEKNGVKPDTASAYFLGTLMRFGTVCARKFIGVSGSADQPLADHIKAFLDGPTPAPMSDQAIAVWAERKAPTVQPSPAAMTIRQAVAKPASVGG